MTEDDMVRVLEGVWRRIPSFRPRLQTRGPLVQLTPIRAYGLGVTKGMIKFRVGAFNNQEPDVVIDRRRLNRLRRRAAR